MGNHSQKEKRRGEKDQVQWTEARGHWFKLVRVKAVAPHCDDAVADRSVRIG